MSIAPTHRPGKPSAITEAAANWALRQEAGALSESEEDAFANWLAENPDHVEAYGNAIWALDAAVHHAGEAPLREMREAALAARPARSPRRWLSAAGGALAASIAAAWLFWGQPANRSTADAVPAAAIAAVDPNHAIYRTQVGERLTVTLPDGSVATLDTGSELKVDYSAHERRLRLLRGQALFEVAHGRPAPFRVAANGQEILAVGTLFNVRIEGREVRVALLEGKIKVRPSNGARAAEVTMQSGETLSALAGAVAVRAADVAQIASWSGGEVVFNDVPLVAAVAEINRYTRQPIRIRDGAIGSYRISGVFRTGDPERFSRAMTEVLPVERVRGADGALVLRARPDE